MLRIILFILLMALLSFPIIQDLTHVVKTIPLKGYVAEPVYKPFTWQAWFDGSFQDAATEYIKGKTGIRPDMVRLINQIDYSAFNKIRAGDVIIGTDGYLYGSPYVDHYIGTSVMSHDQWAAKLYKLKMVQDTLAKLGISMVSIHAASKPPYFPEHLPADILSQQKPINDHKIFNSIADSLGIHLIDFNSWFVSIKGKTQGHLFTRLGQHWSIYGGTMAADSFVKYAHQVMKLNIPDMKFYPGDPQYVAQKTDNDIFQELNLMVPAPVDTYYYPSLSFGPSPPVKPKFIFITDSFMWTWMGIYIPHNISTDWEFWYYNSEIYTSVGGMKQMASYDWTTQLLKSQCVVLMFSEGNIANFGAGFIEKAYHHFYEK